ncbi:hypothetical protein EVAR_51007_1 [Eumeta japonica]|uniref:Uncharacterized protein n=1 Tax=Eumeta variegata TaxID=151549 RepID=A0A4C1ZWI7_EUMVA|nr:hypothetical protein EVAR_51007_1 [Eumeta japonica]
MQDVRYVRYVVIFNTREIQQSQRTYRRNHSTSLELPHKSRIVGRAARAHKLRPAAYWSRWRSERELGRRAAADYRRDTRYLQACELKLKQ